VASLNASEPSTINGAKEVVSVSLPEFWTLIKSVSE
jgi:5-enolpyruvylshikimate-3-phosphate synthase